MWPFVGAIALVALLALLVIGERAFERGRARSRRRQLAAPKRDRPTD